jgi:CheY-like chemotaxis protein
LLEVWGFALEYAGYTVERARDGREALRCIERHIPDLIVTDLMMPGMNGDDLCRVVRGNSEWADIPIVLHTSAYVSATAGTSLWNSVLRKPARMEEFLSTVGRLLQR